MVYTGLAGVELNSHAPSSAVIGWYGYYSKNEKSKVSCLIIPIVMISSWYSLSRGFQYFAVVNLLKFSVSECKSG